MVTSVLIRSPVLAADGRAFLPFLYLAVALLLGAVVVVLVAKWRRSRPALSPSASDQLAQYRLLYEQGAISEEEFKKLRALLGGELRKNLDLSPAPRPAQPAASEQMQPPTEPEPPPATGIRPT